MSETSAQVIQTPDARAIRAAAAAALFRLDDSWREQDVLAALGVPLRDAQTACSLLGDGHAYETYDNGDPETAYRERYTVCEYCGAPPPDPE